MVDPNIKKKADDIRNKVYGKEVRESLASGLEEMSSDVVETVGRQDEVEGQWQNVVDETTGKDVISAPEIIAARDGEANLKARLDKEKNEVTTQLDQTVKYPTLENEQGVVREDVPYGFVTRYGAINETDCTEAITNAIAFCNATKTTLHFPKGRFLDSKERLLATNVSGESLTGSEWVYTGDSQFITVDSQYQSYLNFKDITITHENKTNNAHGVKTVHQVGNSWWGGSLRTTRVAITFFGGRLLHLIDAYNCLFTDSLFEGVSTSTILTNEGVNSFSNVNTFNQCVFLVGKIGIRTHDIADMKFNGCTFEDFDLFMYNTQNKYAPMLIFENSHFENFRKGIINAKMNEETLEPILPIQNKVDPKLRYFFKNNMQSTVPEFSLDPIVNPEFSEDGERKYYFYFYNGLVVASPRYYYPENGWVYKTEQGLMINTVLATATYENGSTLSNTWKLRRDFVESPRISYTLNKTVFRYLKGAESAIGQVYVTNIDTHTVKIEVKRMVGQPDFEVGDSVAIDLTATGRWL